MKEEQGQSISGAGGPADEDEAVIYESAGCRREQRGSGSLRGFLSKYFYEEKYKAAMAAIESIST